MVIFVPNKMNTSVALIVREVKSFTQSEKQISESLL